MPLTKRSGSSVYEEVPGYSVNQYAPSSGSGVTSYTNPSTGTVSYTNQYSNLGWSNAGAPADKYDTYTQAFGMLATGFGANIAYANTLSLRDVYPGSTSRDFGGGLSVSVAWSMANQQALTGSAAYYRKIGKDLTPPNQAVTYQTDQLLSNLGGAYAKYVDNKYYPKTTLVNRNYVAAAPYKAPSLNSSSMSGYDKYLQNKARGNIAISSRPVSSGGIGNSATWFKPNINLYGGYGTQTYRSDTRLLHPALDQGRGTYTSARYSIRTSYSGSKYTTSTKRYY